MRFMSVLHGSYVFRLVLFTKPSSTKQFSFRNRVIIEKEKKTLTNITLDNLHIDFEFIISMGERGQNTNLRKIVVYGKNMYSEMAHSLNKDFVSTMDAV
ncbi:hypothetical protein AVEN_237719-1 [Araneus ventricosus]|uniref:Uncharacterized protein n=1 Tax=Araneus ventricosus TaxID=182803 RepID=A0A4Y2TLH4_ARAVE|nr:hypothetical protein AVEN_237719-1 [Araneus ventricosus]